MRSRTTGSRWHLMQCNAPATTRFHHSILLILVLRTSLDLTREFLTMMFWCEQRREFLTDVLRFYWDNRVKTLISLIDSFFFLFGIGEEFIVLLVIEDRWIPWILVKRINDKCWSGVFVSSLTLVVDFAVVIFIDIADHALNFRVG